MGVAPAGDFSIRYPRSGGGIAHYLLARHDSVAATLPSGETQVQVFGSTAFVTLTWVASDTGAKITASVDSVLPDSGLTFLPAVLDSARGARWAGWRQPTGVIRDLVGGPSSLIGDQVREQIQLIFPVLPPDGVRPGDVWTDSTSGPVRVSAFEALESAHLDSRAEAGVATGGAVPIVVVRTRTAAGQGTQFGQPFNIRATGSDTLFYHVASDGRVLSVDGVRTTALVVELPSIGQSVPAREHTSLRMSLLR